MLGPLQVSHWLIHSALTHPFCTDSLWLNPEKWPTHPTTFQMLLKTTSHQTSSCLKQEHLSHLISLLWFRSPWRLSQTQHFSLSLTSYPSCRSPPAVRILPPPLSLTLSLSLFLSASKWTRWLGSCSAWNISSLLQHQQAGPLGGWSSWANSCCV